MSEFENAPPLPDKQCSSPPPPLSDETLLVKVQVKRLPSDSLLDAEYRCCCGTFHVERGAHWIAVVGIVLCVMSLLSTVYTRSYMAGISAVLSIAVYAGILVAQRKQEPLWYVPYLVMKVVSLALVPIYIGGCALLMVYMREFFEQVVYTHSKREDFAPYTEEQLIFGGRVALGIVIASLMVGSALGLWFLSVVWRAYKFMKMSNQARSEIRYA